MFIFLLVFGKQGFRGFDRSGVDYQLGVVRGRCRGRVGRGEARRAVADERGHRLDAAVLQEHVLERVDHGLRVLKTCVAVEADLHGEEVPVGHGHHLDVELQEQHHREGHGSYTGSQCELRMAETPVLCAVVGALEGCEELVLNPGERTFLLHAGGLYESDFKRGYHEDRVQQRGGQRYRHHPGEVGHEVAQIAGDDAEAGEEHQAQGRGRRDHGRHELARARLGCVFARHALAELSHIAVHRDDGVVHYHAEHYYQSGQRDRVQSYSGQEHDREGHGRADRDAGAGDQSRPDGEEHEHHENDHEHRYHEIPEEREHGVAHQLGLVGDPGHRDAVGQFLLVFVYDFVEFLAECDYVVVRTHLHRDYQAGVAVVVDEGARILVAALYLGYVLEPHDAARRVAPDYPFGYLPLAAHGRFDMYGGACVARVETSARHLEG